MEVSLLASLMDPQVSVRMIHFIGAVVALGAVTVTDSMIVYMHFRNGFSEVMSKISMILSMIVWTGLFVLGSTGAFLIYTNPSIAAGTFFQLKFSLVVAIFLNGIILNEKVYPRFQEIAGHWDESDPEISHFEKFAAIFGLISILGWWTIMLMVHLKPYLPF